MASETKNDSSKFNLEEVSNIVVPKLKSAFTSTTFVWFATYYFMTMLGGMLIGIAYDGPKGIFTYGERIVELYLYYGLNNNSNVTFWLQYNPWAFFIAPLFSMYMGPLLYFLPLGGWAVNGARINDPDGNLYGMFFRDPVPGAEIYFFGNPKFNVFYILTVWMPIVVTIVVSIVYSIRKSKGPNVTAITFINLVLSWFVAIPIAKAGGTLIWHWDGIFRSLVLERSFDFQNRVVNQFIEYHGMYHPGAVAMTAWLIAFLPIVFYSLIKYIYGREYTLDPIIDLKNSIMKKFIEIPEELPWEEEEENNNTESN